MSLVDYKDILLVLIGAALSLVGSLYITHTYYKKNKPIENMIQSITENLRHILVRSRFPEFYDNSRGPRVAIEKGFNVLLDKDVPQLDEVIFDRAIIYPGNRVNVLFKVVDLGYNFRNPDGAKAFYPENCALRVENVGFGLMRTTFNVEDSVKPGSYKLVFELIDEDKYGNAKTGNDRPVRKEVPFRVSEAVNATTSA